MKNIPKLLRYVKNDAGKLVLYFICSLLSVIFAIFTFGMIAPVLQTIFVGVQTLPSTTPATGFDIVGRVTNIFNQIIETEGKSKALTYSVIIVMTATILKNMFLYLSMRILNPLKNNVLNKVRGDMFSKALALPMGYFTEEKKGDITSKMTNDVNEVEASIISVVETILREPITLILVLGTMFIMSVKLTLFMFIFLPIAGLIIGRIGKSLKKPSNLAQEKLGEMLGVIDETLSGMRVVKSFNAEQQMDNKFQGMNAILLKVKNKISARRDASSPISETLGIIVVCTILWVGGNMIFSGQTTLTGSFFITYIGLFYQIINPLKNLSSVFYNMQKGAAALDRMEDFLNTDVAIKEVDQPAVLNNFEDKIEFENVTFAYQDKTILNNINLTIEKGKTIALVGASGSGKSTLVDLIPRFHDVKQGNILINGKDIREVKIYDLRKLIGMVSQEPILFNDTIANNITLGTIGATQSEIEAAAKIANAHQFIINKEDGYNTYVGDRGSKLSGGERQRITIARAVLKNPPILILDEATSSLDTASEKIVQDAINQLMKNRTCIVIAHRLSTVYNADEIVVLNKGEIIERGNHDTLMAKNGAYRQLVDLQQMR